jgi:hypothetical protein
MHINNTVPMRTNNIVPMHINNTVPMRINNPMHWRKQDLSQGARSILSRRSLFAGIAKNKCCRLTAAGY